MSKGWERESGYEFIALDGITIPIVNSYTFYSTNWTIVDRSNIVSSRYRSSYINLLFFIFEFRASIV